MDVRSIQKFFIRKLMDFSPPKWGASHTEERNLFKGMPKHLIGVKETKKALEELYRMGFICRYKKTNETHVSLNNRIPLIYGWCVSGICCAQKPPLYWWNSEHQKPLYDFAYNKTYTRSLRGGF